MAYQCLELSSYAFCIGFDQKKYIKRAKGFDSSGTGYLKSRVGQWMKSKGS